MTVLKYKNLLKPLLLLFFFTGAIYSQVSPTITLPTDKTVCSSSGFTFTVTDVQSATTTYTLNFGTASLVEVSDTGQATFTIVGGIVSSTLFTVVAENTIGSNTATATILVPILGSTGTISTTASLAICNGEALDSAIYGDGTLGTASATLDADSSSASITYQWQYKTGGDPWQNFPGASTSSTLSTNTLAAFPIFENITIRRVSYATLNGVSCADGLLAPELSVTVTSIVDPVINLPVSGTSICVDQDYTFTTPPIGGVTHTWYLAGALVETGDSFTLTAGTIAVDTTLGLVAFNGTCSSTLVSTTLEVTPLPSLTLSTGRVSNTFCSGDNFTLTVQDVQASTTTYTLFDGTNTFTEVSNTGQVTFLINNITKETVYTVSAESAAGCSSTSTLTVFVPKMDDGGAIATTDLTVCAGDNLSVDLINDTLATLTADSSLASITYQWQRFTGAVWENIPGLGTTSSSLLSSTLLTFTATDTQLRRVASAELNGVTCDAEYAYVNLNVSQVGTPVILSPTPGVFNFCEGEAITFTADGDLNPGSDTFYWRIGTTTSTGNTFDLTMTPDLNGRDLELYLVTTAGCTSTLAKETISVTESLTFSIATDQPGDTVCSGENIQINITLGPGAVGTTTFTFDLGGLGVITQTSSSLTTSFTQDTDIAVYVENGSCNSLTQTITVFVPKIDSAGALVLSDPNDNLICSGDDPSEITGDGTGLSLVASSTSAAVTVTYQWFFKTDSMPAYVETGADPVLDQSENYNPGPLLETTNYIRKAYANLNGVSCDVTQTAPITIAVDNERTPEILLGGLTITDLELCNSEEITLSAGGALAGTDTYTWYISNVAQVSGTINYTIPAGTLIDGDQIKLEIETSEGCLYETIIPVTVTLDPVINLTSNAKVPHVVCETDQIKFTVTEVASATYYWSKYSTTTPTAVALGGSPTQTNSLTVNALTLTDGDIISVTVSYTNACSVTDSITVNIIDQDPGTIDVVPPILEVCSSDIPANITSTAEASSTNGSVSITYDWEYSTNNRASWNSTGVNSPSLEFGGTLPETRIYRRVAIFSWAGVELCRTPTLLDLEIRVRDPEGGTFAVDNATVCYSVGALGPELTVTGAATGTYQWQDSSDGVTFTNIPGAQNPKFTPTITSTATVFYRRVTFSTATCSDTTDNIFTLNVSDLDPGSLSTSPTAVYCYGSQPPMLGIGTSVDGSSSLGPVTYIWKSKILGQPGGFAVIPGENNRNYQPPPLFADPTNTTTSYLYQRIAVDGSGCESAPTNTVTITIAPLIEPGDLGFKNVAPLNYYICEGQENPDDLVLRNATAISAGVVTYTWQSSTDQFNWSTVPSSTSNSQLTFGDSNTPTQTTYYRVMITSGNPVPTAVSPTLVINLRPTGDAISFGETYDLYIDGNNIQVTTSAAVSTTDTIGQSLATEITNNIPGYNATYYADYDQIVVNEFSNNVSLVRATNGVSTTLFLEGIVTQRATADDYCTSYSNVLTVNVYEAPTITQITAPFDSQIICVGEAMAPVTFEYGGSVDYVEISGIASPAFEVTVVAPGTATYSSTTQSWFVSNTTKFTITGTPTLAENESLVVRMETQGACRDEVEATYRIETVNGPDTPDLIYRNVAQAGRALEQKFQIFQHADGTWVNNTICQDELGVPPTDPSLTYEFAACYSNGSSLRDVNFDWEVIPPAAISSLTFKNDGNTRMVADVTVNNITSTTTFTAGEVFTITITGPDGNTDTVNYTTNAVDFDDLVDELDTAFSGLNYILPITQADRDGDGVQETLVFTADIAGVPGYFRLSITNPNNAEFLLESPVYQYPLKDNAIQVIFNPDFGTTTGTTGGVTATLRVRAESVECTGVYSDWYEVELFVVDENDPVSPLPTLREPFVYNTIDVCEGTAYNAIPTCELTTTQSWETIFYSAPTATSSYTYGYLEWKIDNIDPSTSGENFPGTLFEWNGGIDPDYGIVNWTQGFYGQFDVCVRAVSCDDSTDSDGDGFDDDNGWVCRTITINPLEALPNIFASDLPVCPIPATGAVTSTFTSDLDVDWSIQPAGAVSATSTTTILGRDALQVVWRNGFSGTAWITAETQSCSSGIRNFTVRIPDDPVLTRTSTATNETVCQGEAITPVTFSVNGYSVIGIDDSDLPNGLNATFTADVQSATFNINRRLGTIDNTALEYIISIDYIDYSLTVSTSASLSQISNEIVDLIEASPRVGSATATIYTTSSTIEIIGADPGVRFNIATNSPRLGRFSFTQPNISIKTGTVEVSGSISETLTTASASYFGVGPDGVSQDHRFELYTISSSASCTSEVGELQIFYNPNHTISTTTPTLLIQEICDGSELDEIIFTLSGGARDYENPVWYPSEPNGVVFSPEAGDVFGATTSFSLSGTINTGITTTTVYYFTLTTTGTTCDTDTVTGTLVVHPNTASDFLDPQQGLNLSYCNGDYVDLKYEFEGIPNLTITSTATLASLGLTGSYTYTNTPSVELTSVATATSVGEVFQVEIVPESGIARSYRFVSVTGSETPTQIAAALATEIDADPQVSASASGTVINIIANNKSYVFWVRINRAGLAGTIDHYNDAKLRITTATPTLGTYSLTGTITLNITNTTSYSLEISSSNNRCDTVTSTTVLTISPSEIIEATNSSDLALEFCDGTAVSSPTFVLNGSATGYSANWIPSRPNGIDFNAAEAIDIGTTTFTLTGTLNTGITTTTVYYYTLTTEDINALGCAIDTITGTLVVHPNTASDRLNPQQGGTYTIDDQTYIDLRYDFLGVPELTVTTTQTIADLNLSSSITYTSTPSVELTLVATATAIGEVFQVEIVEEDGGYRTYNFESITGSETPTQLATALAAELDADPKVSATASGSIIQIEAINEDYVFWIRINNGDTDESVAHYNETKMRITGGVPVQGFVSITGTPTLGISSTTTYSLELSTNSNRCDTVTTTTIVRVNPAEIIIPISPPDNKLEFFDNTTGVASPVFVLAGATTDYTVSWSEGSPPNLSFVPAPGNIGTTTVTLSGDISTGISTTKVYYYTITSVGPGTIADVVTGTVVIYPNDPAVLLNPLQGDNLSYCDGTYINLEYEFTGIPELTITSTNTLNTLGLNTAVTYNTTPSIELTIVQSSTQANEFYSIEIVEEDGTYRSHVYKDVAGTQTPTQIASALAGVITTDPKVTATASGTSIIIESNDLNYVFWVRINIGNQPETIAHYDTAKIRVTDATEVSGVLSISGTPTLAITDTTTYTLTLETTSDRASTVTTSTQLTINPSDYIEVTQLADLNLEFCDGDAVSSPTFVLSGSAYGYSVSWTGANGKPNGINFNQPANVILGTSTFTLQGTLDTGVTTTTIYPYTITTIGSDGCNKDTISGSITVNPLHYITLTSAPATASQEICNVGEAITPIVYTFSGGATTYNISWTGGAIGLNTFNTSNTLTISGTVNVPGGLTQTTSYTYTITTIGNACDAATVSGVITVVPELDYTINTLGTVNQTGAAALCNNDSIQDIVFTVVGGEGAAQVSLTWTTANELENVVPNSDATNTVWTVGGVVNENVTQLTSYPYQITIYRPGSCVTPVSFTGNIQVAPNPTVDQDFIQANDVTDVTCEGGSDGSIIIPTSPENEFIKRITGGQLAAQQIDAVTVSATSSLTAGDVIKLQIDGFNFEATVGAGQTTVTVLEALALQINSGVNSVNINVNASVISTTTPPELLLTADTAGVGFTTTSVTVVSLTNTVTTLIDKRVANEVLNYTYDWYNENNVLIGSGPSIENLEAGIYKLAVSVNGCVSSPTTQEFIIEEPSTTIGTVSESCDGNISIPIDAYFTPTQLNQVGVTLRAELFSRAVDNSYSISVDFETFNAATASNSYVVNFNGLAEGETYQLVVTDNSCAQRTTQIIGPISEELSINELLLSSTDEECAGEGGTLTVENNAIDGGSGSFSYEWTNGTDSYNLEDVVGAAPGQYTLTVTDKVLGCTATTVGLIEITESDTLNVVPADPIITINDCVDGREGRLAVNVTGGDGINYSYEWEFTPANSSNTIALNNDSPILVPDDEIPAGLSSTGNYTVYVYDGEIADGCAASDETFTITGPTPVEFVATSSTNVTCLEGSNGTITFEVSGGIAPYKYSLNGGVPNTAVTSKVMTIENLEAGTYQLVVGDSSSQACNPTNVTEVVEVIITEPSGTRLELTEDELIGIPCSGGTGSIRLGISGGATNSTTTNFQVFVSGPDGYRKNDAVDATATTYLLENLPSAGTYNITISDALANICNPTTIEIVLEEEAAENLAATAIIIPSSDCSSESFEDSSGASIQITSFDKGDGEVSGYPLWQRRTSIDLYRFTISLNGNISGIDASQIGLTIDGASFDASGTASITSIQDLASNLAIAIDQAPNFTARLNGSQVIVSGEVIDEVLSNSSSGTTVNLTFSQISSYQESRWSEVPGLAGLEKIENLQAGVYRGILRDGSGCGSTLVQNTTQGGSTFQIDDPQSLQFDSIEFDEVTCTQPTSNLKFKLSNGVYTYAPNPSAFELTLNSIVLESTVGGSVSFSTGTTTASTASTTTSSATAATTIGSTYTPNLTTNAIEIESLPPGDYELVVKNRQTECLAVLNFTINEAESITYSGATEFDIDPCYEAYQDVFFDQFLIEGGEPFTTSNGDPFYSLKWTYTPNDPNQNSTVINSVSNNVNFAPLPGTYELLIYDANGCTILDENGNETPLEFVFNQSLSSIEVLPAGGINGDEFSTPVSCEIDAEDGQISIEVNSSDPFEIKWHRQESATNANEQRLLFQGVAASQDSLEVYAIRLNDIPIAYSTQENNEPIASVVNEFAQRINDNILFTAAIDPAGNANEIIIRSASNAAITLEIVSQSTRLQMINSSLNVATWVPLDGTNGNPNYTGYLSLNNLSEGLYRYTISAIDVANCDNGAEPNTIQQVIAVENENILEIREGPIVDEYLCNGQSGTIFIDVFDGDTGPLTFFYNSTPITYERVGTNQYLLNIDNPVEVASLEIYNAANCGLSREINIGNGTPLFDFNSTNFLQSGTFLAREDITFTDLSENEYDTFEFIFGDGTQSELLERNSPEPVIHEYAISGTYYVTLRIYNDLGCMEELIKTIKVGKGYSILVPNVFTPNGDIWNKTFRPVFNGLSEIILRVYDSQGGLLYEEVGTEGADPDKIGLSLRGWEGETNAPSSSFFIYTITAKTIDDEPVFRDGTFILLK